MSNYWRKIPEWPEDERPREKLVQFGPENISDAELLAILLRIGNREQSAIDLARYLIREAGGLEGIDGRGVSELCQIKGIGPAKAAQLKAALEIGKRLLSTDGRKRKKIISSQDVYRVLSPHLRRRKREAFKVIFLTRRNTIIGEKTLFEGSLTESLINPREIVKSALAHSAAGVIFVHNHPSGDPSPSPEDQTITDQLTRACTLVNIRVVDHIIIGDGGYYSFADEKQL
ncbi:MAG: DNA repair protein RadC [Proteobacteria bacterium]|nr:DNA repair protein RadC [Pseudomonadota bacterium]